LSGLNAAYERWIYLGDVGIPGLANCYIENRAATYALSAGGLELTFVGSGPAIEDWDEATDEGPPPPLIPDAMPSAPPVPANLTCSLENFSVASGVTAKRIVCVFDKPIPLKDRDYATRWRVADEDTVTAGAQPGDWTQQIHRETPAEASATQYRLKTSAVQAGEILDVQIASLSSKGTLSDWSPVANVGP
jgi:hypothetical protein